MRFCAAWEGLSMRFKSIASRIIISVIPIITLSTLIFIGVTYYASHVQTNEYLDEKMNESSLVASLSIQLELSKNANITRDMAIYGQVSAVEAEQPEELAFFVKESIYSNINTVGGGIWYEPYTAGPNQKYYSAYAFRDENGNMVVTMDYANEIDYLQEPWYVEIGRAHV